MSFDNSRSTFNPWRDYFGVVMQQGRVQLDSDWNEWLAEFARRIQAGTLDILGLTGVPSTTPYAFKINAFLNTTSKHQVTIGAGRIYVDGLLAENHGLVGSAQWDPALAEWSGSPQTSDASEMDIDYTDQPYLLGATLPPGNGPFLVYLDVWQRDVTYLEDPDLVEKAVGIDTTGRRQTIWQVKLLDVSSVAGGVACSTPDSAITPWENLIQPSVGALTTGLVPSIASGPCSLSPATGFTGLENQLYRVEIHREGSATSSPRATFKWSRENASVATAVIAISSVTNSVGKTASQLTVQSMGRDQVLGFHPGDWIEITDDVQELNGQAGELHQIDNINSTAKIIVLDSTVTSASFPLSSSGQTDPNRHTRIQRWDQAGTVFQDDGTTVWVDLNAAAGSNGIPVPPSGTKLILENGITVAFDPNPSGDSSQDTSFETGDFWTFAARTADGSVENLKQAAPRGIHHHYCRLGIVDFTASPPKVVDCRHLFPSLANPSVHVTSVFLGGVPLLNDGTVTVQNLANGINVVCDVPLAPATITQPTCFVTVDLPAPTTPPGGGFNPFILSANVSLGASNTISWKPTDAAQSALQNQVSPTGPPLLAHLTLKGNFIWTQDNPEVYLNGAAMGVPDLSGPILHVHPFLPRGEEPRLPSSDVGAPGRPLPPGVVLPDLGGRLQHQQFTRLQLPSGDGRRSADFEMWFWLTSQPIVTLSATTLNFNTPQLVGTSSTQSVTLNNNGTATLSISIAVGGVNPGDFSQSNTCGQTVPAGASCTISVTFTPTAAGTRTAQINITESADTNPLVITLTGTGIQPQVSFSPTSLNFPVQTVGTASAPQTVTLANSGSSQLTISGVAISSSDYSQTSTCVASGGSGSLQPGQQCTISVQFTPTATGSRTANLVISNNAGDVTIPLTGTGIAGVPAVSASPTSLAFGAIVVDGSAIRLVTLTSTGNVALVITNMAITGVNADSYSLISNTCGGGTLQPTQQCNISVQFNPATVGALNAQLQISHNAPGSPLTIPLAGSGKKPPKEGKDTAIEKVAVQEKILGPMSTVRPSSSTDTPPEGGGEGAKRRAFISPEERPSVGPPRSGKPDDEPPNEGPKEE